MYVVPAILGSATALTLYQLADPSVALVVAPLTAFILGTVAYWAKWYVPASNEDGRFDIWVTKLVRALEPNKIRAWRREKEATMRDDPLADDGVMPTKGEVRDQLEGSAEPTPDEFLAALFRVYVDRHGEGSSDGWARD